MAISSKYVSDSMQCLYVLACCKRSHHIDSYWWLSSSTSDNKTIPLTLPPCLMGRITAARDYFHLIVCVPGCVNHQIPYPAVSQCRGIKDPVAGQTGSLKLGVTGKQMCKPEQLVLEPAENKQNNEQILKRSSETKVKFLLRPFHCCSTTIQSLHILYYPASLWFNEKNLTI